MLIKCWWNWHQETRRQRWSCCSRYWPRRTEECPCERPAWLTDPFSRRLVVWALFLCHLIFCPKRMEECWNQKCCAKNKNMAGVNNVSLLNKADNNISPLVRKQDLANRSKVFELIKETLGLFYKNIYSSSLDWY